MCRRKIHSKRHFLQSTDNKQQNAAHCNTVFYTYSIHTMQIINLSHIEIKKISKNINLQRNIKFRKKKCSHKIRSTFYKQQHTHINL